MVKRENLSDMYIVREAESQLIKFTEYYAFTVVLKRSDKYGDIVEYYHATKYKYAYEYAIFLAKQLMGSAFDKVYQNNDDKSTRFVNSEDRSKKYEVVWKYNDKYNWSCKIVNTNNKDVSTLDVCDSFLKIHF